MLYGADSAPDLPYSTDPAPNLPDSTDPVPNLPDGADSAPDSLALGDLDSQTKIRYSKLLHYIRECLVE